MAISTNAARNPPSVVEPVPGSVRTVVAAPPVVVAGPPEPPPVVVVVAGEAEAIFRMQE